MSLLGIDVGTTGCKSGLFSQDGRLLAFAYEEYDFSRPEPGWAQLDSVAVWEQVKRTILAVAANASTDPIQALSVSSFGEAMVPVTQDRQILGPCLLNFDVRGEEYLPGLSRTIENERLYRINGNTLGNHYGLTKLKWIQQHQPELYEHAWKFLLWGSFIPFMLGAEPTVDYSLANRTLLFDIDRCNWSDELLKLTGLDCTKLPDVFPAGTVIGQVSGQMAHELGLPANVTIVAGGHDQCLNAVGCGVIQPGRAMYGMGTYLCAVPVFTERREPAAMMRLGLNTEHHAAPGQNVSFIYNQGGSIVKWFRDTFAAIERREAQQSGRDIYADLIAEMPEEPSSILALPHWSTTGPPHFISNSSGVLVGLRFETTRGDILKGLIEGITFYLRECIETLPQVGIEISDYCAVGGGSKSDVWLQMTADILGRPFVRSTISESGILGAAIIAGAGCGVFPSVEAGVEVMVKLDRTFEPDQRMHKLYAGRFEQYKQLWTLLKDYLRGSMA
jgi:xylulokinase